MYERRASYTHLYHVYLFILYCVYDDDARKNLSRLNQKNEKEVKIEKKKKNPIYL